MSNDDIVRAWKDAVYRLSLSEEQRAALPEHPAGGIELTDDQLQQASGASTALVLTAGCCPSNLWSYCDTVCIITSQCMCGGPAPLTQ